MRFNRVFVIVLDSLGIGPMADSARFDDAGADTLGHISETVELWIFRICRDWGLPISSPLSR